MERTFPPFLPREGESSYVLPGEDRLSRAKAGLGPVCHLAMYWIADTSGHSGCCIPQGPLTLQVIEANIGWRKHWM